MRWGSGGIDKFGKKRKSLLGVGCEIALAVLKSFVGGLENRTSLVIGRRRA